MMDWDVEYKKCQEDPHYFFTTYWLVDGKPGTTHMTKEQFNDFFELEKIMKRNHKEELFRNARIRNF